MDTKKPVDHFEVGKWYKWVGPKERQNGWNHEGEMDFMLSGKPYKCIESNRESWSRFLGFDKYEWAWGDLSNFREVPEPRESEYKKMAGSNPTMEIRIDGKPISFPIAGLRFTDYSAFYENRSLTQKRRDIRARLLARI